VRGEVVEDLGLAIMTLPSPMAWTIRSGSTIWR